MEDEENKITTETVDKEQHKLKVENMGNYFKVILEDKLKNESLSNEEKKIALKILEDLNGSLVIRANSILNFCSKAIQHARFRIR